jgi:hypothetical protein
MYVCYARAQRNNFITVQNERQETTQNITITKSAACALLHTRVLVLLAVSRQKNLTSVLARSGSIE